MTRTSPPAEVQIQPLPLQSKLGARLGHRGVQLHEGTPHALDLRISQAAGLHPAQGLPLDQLAEQFHDGQDQPRKATV